MEFLTIQKISSKAVADPKGLVAECERAYKEKISLVARDISERQGRELVMLAGPSSSGKTTTAKLLKNMLMKKGRSAKVISLDDFYLDQDVSYTFEDGTTDFETVKALDVELIEKCLTELMSEGCTMMPRFSFHTRQRNGYERVCCKKDEIIIVEGLHALNPIITDPLEDERMKKLYVSVSSRITDEGEPCFSKRDLRFIRRLIRDYHFRNTEVEYTFYLWKGVRMGEDRYLFPFSDRADVKIDSVHPYEICLFRNEAIKLLDTVDEDSIYFERAQELKKKLTGLPELDKRLIPSDSLMHEFIG